MKNYIKIPEHGYGGDFYLHVDPCKEDGDRVFRADNLRSATQVAFNNWLRDFDALYRSCTRLSLEEGTFTVAIQHHLRSGETDGPAIREIHAVTWHGPPDLYTAEYARRYAGPEMKKLYERMIEAYQSGHPSVRLSNRSGAVIFTCDFPYWSSASAHLAYDNLVVARQQIATAGLM